MNFILDEFANFTKLESFQSMITVSRSRNCKFVLALQSFAQIEEKYGKEGSQNILDNCVLLYLKTNNIDTASKISERTSELILHKVMVKVVILISSTIIPIVA